MHSNTHTPPVPWLCAGCSKACGGAAEETRVRGPAACAGQGCAQAGELTCLRGLHFISSQPLSAPGLQVQEGPPPAGASHNGGPQRPRDSKERKGSLLFQLGCRCRCRRAHRKQAHPQGCGPTFVRGSERSLPFLSFF